MKLLGLSKAVDEKADYRIIAEETNNGNTCVPVETFKVELFTLTVLVEHGYNEPKDTVSNPITKEEIAKLANKLRNGLREFGRYNVKVEGNIAEISVSSRAVRAPKKKVVTLPDAPKVPAAKKAAKA